jgi:hypothetical protein
MNIDLKKAKQQFNSQRVSAKDRNIDWQFTFEEWLTFWTNSGYYHLRGRRRGEYCMSRYNDIGPYSKSNVFIQSHGDNVSQAGIGNKHGKQLKGIKRSSDTKKKMSLAALARPPMSDEIKQKISQNKRKITCQQP